MPPDDALRHAAERNGVQQEFRDAFGRRHCTSPKTNRAILTALGFDCTSEETLRESLDRRELAENSRPLPPVMVVGENAPLRLPESVIATEQGDIFPYTPDLKLPLGYHEVRARGGTMRLIVTPDRAWLPDEDAKRAGLGVMLYSLRSHRNWGCGDFRDLRDLVDWSAEVLHAAFIALNPLHAIQNRRPYNTSPYLPASIFYRNFLYLDIESIPGFDCIRHRFEDGETRAELQRLRLAEQVEYEKVADLKRRALELIFNANPPARDCREWIAEEGDLLRLYSTWCALDEHLHRENPEAWVWPDWPEEYRDPGSPAVHRFAREHDKEILFHGWVQWQVDRQLASLQEHARAAGMSLGLYHDMALATDSCGSDLWAHRSFYIAGCRVGSPPDAFSPTGQDWSFPPPNGYCHREDGYRLYIESIRKSLRHGGALRIDHVMRLFRLYWIPRGQDATEGAYVSDRAEDLVRILALESVRNQTVIVGEDLGTVEPEVRETLARFGILSNRLLYFERNGHEFKAPGEYPKQALVSSTTHDLPTIAGFWNGGDIEARMSTGVIGREAGDAQWAVRVEDKQKLLDALHAADLLPADYERNAVRIPELTGELHYAMLAFLALTPSALWLINQEDITKEPAQQNLPGTTSEYPNWRRKMRWSIEDLRDLPQARDCAAMVQHCVEIGGRAEKH